MSRIDYYSIEKELQFILQNEPSLNEVTVLVEEMPELAADMSPFISIFLDRREVPSGQPIAGGTRQRMLLKLSVWCYVVEIESVEAACKKRDDLVGKVEVALMNNRTINDSINHMMIDGGEFDNVSIQSVGLAMGGSVVVLLDVTAVS